MHEPHPQSSLSVVRGPGLLLSVVYAAIVEHVLFFLFFVFRAYSLVGRLLISLLSAHFLYAAADLHRLLCRPCAHRH